MCTDQKSTDLKIKVKELHNMIEPLRQGDFSEGLGKVIVYVESAARSLDSAYAALRVLEERRSNDSNMDPEEYRREKEAIENRFNRSLQNALSFARRNLDSVLLAAIEELVRRPRQASRTDLEKRAQALQKSFERMDDPVEGMFEHYIGSSDPLNKYLVAGPWGHEYLRKRKINLLEFDRRLCEILGCQDTAAGRVLLSYTELCQAIDRVEADALRALN